MREKYKNDDFLQKHCTSRVTLVQKVVYTIGDVRS